MTKNFSSVVKLVTSLEEGREKDLATHSRSPVDDSNHLQADSRAVTLPATQPLPLSTSPRSTQLQAIRFSFDQVLRPDVSQAVVYKTSVKDIVESCLLGYHGTVISFGTECGEGIRGKEDVLICKAAEQVFRCLKKSRRSRSRSSTSNLVMLCSNVIIAHEKVHDLLYDYSADKDESVGDTAEGDLPPELHLVNGSVLRASQHKVKGGRVSSLLKFAREMERKVVEFYQKDQESSTPRGKQHSTEKTHHTVFTLTVEYSQFGSMNAPVSGNLMFVNIAPSDPLANRQQHTTGDQVATEVVSLFTFADIVNSLTPNAGIMDNEMRSSGSAFNVMDEGQSSQLPCVPETTSKELYQYSVLTQLLQDSLGGNCKTLLITYVPELVLSNRYGELYETLKIASRARLIQNTPNKRDLAEKALMSAYMRGLQEMYGQGVLAKQEEKKPRRIRLGHTPVTPFQDTRDGGAEMKSTSKDSLSSDDIDTAYDEMINITEGEKRQQNMEMAATALVSAALEDSGEEEEEEVKGHGDEDLSSREEEDSSSDDVEPKPSQTGGVAPLKAKVRLKKKKKKIHPRKTALIEGGVLESTSVTSFTERDVTIDVLINIIQDPDKGVPRPPVSDLKDVQVRKDAGTIFSGAELVRWMVQNIDGVENQRDAEILGQLLLNKGAIYHSEGSKVFANAETLFYYTSFSRPTKKVLSLEEIKRLLSQATGLPEVQKSDSVMPRNVTTVHPEEEKQSNGDGMTVTEVDNEEVDDNEPHLNHDQTGLSHDKSAVVAPREEMTLVQQLETVEVEKEEEAVAEGQGMVLQDVANGEIPEMTSDQYTSYEPDQEQGVPQYEGYLTDEEQVEQAQAELLKKLEEDSGEPNTVAQEHIPSVQTLEKTTNYPHPLHMAVAIGKSSGVVRQLVMMFGVNKRDEYNRTPLMFAALGNNKSSSCSTLIECGAEVDWQDICGLTALHVACYHGNRAAVNVLLNKKASVCIFDSTYHSAYHWSTVADDHSCLQLLMSVGTPDLVMYADRCGLTALHWAINYDHPQHLKLLLKMCKEPLKLDSEGRTFMTYAIQQQAFQCIKVLLSAHASLLTHADTKGAAPLHHASVQKSTQFLNLLFSHKLPKKSKVSLDVNCKNRSGRTPLHCAIAYNHLQNATLLVTRGAHVTAVDNNGKSCMDYANELGDGDRELMLAALQTGESEAKVQADGEDANSLQLNAHTSSKVCITL